MDSCVQVGGTFASLPCGEDQNADWKPLVPWQEQPVPPLMSGTQHIAVGYPSDLPNRTLTGILKKPTVIDRAWETVAPRPQRSNKQI
jgi:hypothetical protein